MMKKIRSSWLKNIVAIALVIVCSRSSLASDSTDISSTKITEKLRRVETEYGPDHPLVALYLTLLAQLHYAQRNYAQAESLISRAVKIQEKTTSDSPTYGASLMLLAQLYREQGQYQQAESMYLQGIAIFKQSPDTEEELAQAYDNLAAVYVAQRKYAEAAEAVKQALRIEEQRLGQNHTDLLPVLNKATMLSTQLQHYDEAETYYDRAITILKESSDPILKEFLEVYIQWLRKNGNIPKAQKIEMQLKYLP